MGQLETVNCDWTVLLDPGIYKTATTVPQGWRHLLRMLYMFELRNRTRISSLYNLKVRKGQSRLEKGRFRTRDESVIA